MSAKWRVRSAGSAASWGLRDAGAPPPPPPPPSGLPSWVPPYGTHSTMPILAGHMPADVFPSIYSSTDAPDPFIDFNGSLALLGGTTKFGMFSSGHHSDGVNFTSTYVLDYSVPGWSTCNDSTSIHLETDPPDHDDNIYADDSVATGHGYTAHVATPKSWSVQGFLQIFFAGSAYPNNVYLRPIGSKTGGVTRMNSAPINDGTGTTHGSYPSAVTWEAGGGVFMSGIANGQLFTPMIREDGSIDSSYPGVGGNYTGNVLVIDERHQLLMAINGYYSGTGSVSLNIVDLPSKAFHGGIPVTNGLIMGNPDASSVEPYRCSWTWSVERDCAFGVSAQTFDSFGVCTTKVLRLRPPATGSRLDPTNPWVCDDITTTHWTSDPVSGAHTALGIPANPPSSDLVMPRWVGGLDSIVLVTQYADKPQVIRPVAGGGPDPGVPAPSPSPSGVTLLLSTGSSSPLAVGTPYTFTVGQSGTFTGGTITPTATGGAGTFSPPSLSGIGSFTFTPTAATSDVAIGLTNTAGATNPTALHFVVTSGGSPPPPPPGGHTLSVSLMGWMGAPAANLTGIKYAIFGPGQATPDVWTSPVAQGAAGTSDTGGVFNVAVPAAGRYSYFLTDSNGNPLVQFRIDGGPIDVT